MPRTPKSTTARTDGEASAQLALSRKEIARVMSHAIAECGVDRKKLAADMSLRLGRRISKAMLDAYTAESRETHIPSFDVAMAFDLATNRHALCRYFAEKLGGQLALEEELLLMRLGRVAREKADILARERDILRGLKVPAEAPSPVDTGVARKLLELDVRLGQMSERQDATLLAVSWLMARHPEPTAADAFMRSQANELEGDPKSAKFAEQVAVLDELYEDVRDWRKLWAG